MSSSSSSSDEQRSPPPAPRNRLHSAGQLSLSDQARLRATLRRDAHIVDQQPFGSPPPSPRGSDPATRPSSYGHALSHIADLIPPSPGMTSPGLPSPTPVMRS